MAKGLTPPSPPPPPPPAPPPPPSPGPGAGHPTKATRPASSSNSRVMEFLGPNRPEVHPSYREAWAVAHTDLLLSEARTHARVRRTVHPTSSRGVPFELSGAAKGGLVSERMAGPLRSLPSGRMLRPDARSPRARLHLVQR